MDKDIFDKDLDIDMDFGDDLKADDTIEAEEIEEPTPVETKAVEVKKPAGAIDFAKVFSDFGPDLSSVPGVVVGDVGLEVSRFAIDRAKFSKEKRDRIAFLTNKVIAIKTHYMDGVGSFLCFGGSCCQVADTPRVKYLFPVLVYDTDKKGRILSKDVSLKVLALGSEAYEAVTMIQEAVEDLTSVDVIVNCTDNDYQKLAFAQAGPVNWRKSAQIANFVAEEWARVKNHVIDPVAKVLTEKQLKDRIASNKEDKGANAGTDLTLDDVFGKDE